jgi:hypothetical protein
MHRRTMLIVLLSGWSGSGKDTVGQILQTKWPLYQIAFADELKRIVCQEFSIPFEWTQTQEGKQRTDPGTGKTVREILVQRGQEIRAEQNDPGFFGTCVANTIMKQYQTKQYCGFVITDWRLPEEIRALEETLAPFQPTFLKVRITNTSQDVSPVADNTTEQQLNKYIFDEYIINDGKNLETLRQQVIQKLSPHIRSICGIE